MTEYRALRVKKICKEQDRCSFIDNDGSFKVANQNQNESLFLRDRHHLSPNGSYQLIHNFSLNDVAFVQKRASRNGFRGGQSDHSNSNDFLQNQQPSLSTKCAWCFRTGHDSANCLTRGTRTCFICKSPSHRANDRPIEQK